MIRHAESPFVLGQERTRSLSPQGKTDAKKVTALMRDTEIDAMISSPYARAIETIEGIANVKNLEINVFEELRERKLKGSFKLSEDEIQEAIKQSFVDTNLTLLGGESIKDVQNRAIPAIRDLLFKYEGKTVVIGTHGNVMTIIMNYFNPVYGYEFWKKTTKPDIYKLVFSGETLESIQRKWA